jgi:hypothetical protein
LPALSCEFLATFPFQPPAFAGGFFIGGESNLPQLFADPEQRHTASA